MSLMVSVNNGTVIASVFGEMSDYLRARGIGPETTAMADDWRTKDGLYMQIHNAKTPAEITETLERENGKNGAPTFDDLSRMMLLLASWEKAEGLDRQAEKFVYFLGGLQPFAQAPAKPEDNTIGALQQHFDAVRKQAHPELTALYEKHNAAYDKGEKIVGLYGKTPDELADIYADTAKYLVSKNIGPELDKAMKGWLGAGGFVERIRGIEDQKTLEDTLYRPTDDALEDVNSDCQQVVGIAEIMYFLAGRDDRIPNARPDPVADALLDRLKSVGAFRGGDRMFQTFAREVSEYVRDHKTQPKTGGPKP